MRGVCFRSLADRVFNYQLSQRWSEELNEIKELLDNGVDWIDIVRDRQLHKLTTKQYLLGKKWTDAEVENWLCRGLALAAINAGNPPGAATWPPLRLSAIN